MKYQQAMNLLIEENKKLGKNIARLLLVCGRIASCKGCGRQIYWLKTKNGKDTPFDESGETHWATCSRAKMFKK